MALDCSRHGRNGYDSSPPSGDSPHGRSRGWNTEKAFGAQGRAMSIYLTDPVGNGIERTATLGEEP